MTEGVGIWETIWAGIISFVSAGIGVSANVGLHTPVIGSKPVLVFGIGFGMGL